MTSTAAAVGLSSTAIAAVVSSTPALTTTVVAASSPAAAASSSSLQAVLSSISASVAASVSAVVLAPSSTPAAAASSAAPAVTSTPANVIVTATGASLAPSTVYYTSVVTQPAVDGSSLPPIIVTVTSVQSDVPASTTARASSTTTSSAAASSTAAALSSNGSSSSSSSSGGLSNGAKTAIAVVIPVVVVALLVIAGLFLWRRRKQSKNAQEARRKEVEEYGYNPNDDPTLPAVGMAASDSPEMTEDAGGYRGWGNSTVAASGSNRKTSTTLSGGALGFPGSDDGAVQNAASYDSGRSAAPLVAGHARTPSAAELEGLDTLGAVGAGIAGTRAYGSGYNHNGVQRGPSNASSSYSAGAHTDQSDDALPGHQQEYGYDHNYSQYTPYHPGTGGYTDSNNQPVIRDVSARRNTKIESPASWPPQGNSGISQNF